MNIYLIVGSTGSYSDFSSWPVRAFARREDAGAFKAMLDSTAQVIEAERPTDYNKHTHKVDYEAWKKRSVRKWDGCDPGFDWSYAYGDVPEYEIKEVRFEP